MRLGCVNMSRLVRLAANRAIPPDRRTLAFPFGSRIRMPRQPVTDPHPRQPRAVMHMVGRRHVLRIVQAGGGDIDLGRMLVALEGKLCAAAAAEAPDSMLGRAIRRGLTRGEAEIRTVDAEPRHRRRAGRAPAHRTMAEHSVERSAARFVADGTAQTAPGQHRTIRSLCHQPRDT